MVTNAAVIEFREVPLTQPRLHPLWLEAVCMRKLFERSLPLRLFAQWHFILHRHSEFLRSCDYHLVRGYLGQVG